MPETVIPRVWSAALEYAVRKNEGALLISSYFNHITKMGFPHCTIAEVHQLYSRMAADGYLSYDYRSGIHTWQVTDKGREAVQ